ncbi:MAG: hypothetical protein A2W03_01775 [Candidatus Aminicenantes bacterium RBG_16_63_16]|nr:MAG: hypothetical protein A2W03_01775 [Candidatus Aminicenantes bacterium RBG_16_63_16]
MAVVNSLLNGLFDALFYPFRTLTAWWGMLYISLLTGLLMLAVFRLTSNQPGIRAAKDRIKAHLLEMRLFKDNFRVSLGAQRQILAANWRYIRYSFKPLLVMIIPLVLILIQLNFWFGYEPLAAGEPAILKVRLDSGIDPLKTEILLETSPSVRVETPPLRIADEHEVDWRIRPQEAGPAALTLAVGGARFEKTVRVGGAPLARVSTMRVRGRFPDALLYPCESGLPPDGPVQSIEVVHPQRRLPFMGLRLHWLVAYFALSIILGFALKRPFKVEI